MSHQSRVFLGLAAISLIWGSTWLGIKLGLEHVPPMLAAALRFFIASAILYLMLRARKETVPATPHFRRLALLMGVLSFTIPFGLIYYGQRIIPTGLASILFATFPFWVALFSHRKISGERFSIVTALSLLLGFGGVIVIFRGTMGDVQSGTVWGMAAVVLAAGLQAFTLVALKVDGEAYSSTVTSYASMLIGAVLLMVMSLLVESYDGTVFDLRATLALLYLSVVGSVVTFVVYFWLVKHVRTVLLSMVSFVTPVIAVALGAVVLDETLGSNTLAGAAMVLSGLAVANGPALRELFLDKQKTAA